MTMAWVAFSDIWEYDERVSFDGVNRRIKVHSDASAIDVKRDLYSAWKRWLQLYDNAKYLPAMRTIGGDPVGSGLFAGDIYFMINGWQIEIGHNVRVNGILYHDDPLDVYVILPGGGVTATVSNLAYSLQDTGLTEEQANQLAAIPSISTDLRVVNRGVKRASILVPHTENLE